MANVRPRNLAELADRSVSTADIAALFATSALDATEFNRVVADNAINVAAVDDKFAAGCFSADTAGRAPFAALFLTNALLAAGGPGYVTGEGGAVTQITNASTGVTLSTRCGQITTVALTTAAAAEEVFVVTNTEVAATDVIVLSTTYAGGGTPFMSVDAVGAGAFSINITNVHATAALDAVMVINFAVIKAVAA